MGAAASNRRLQAAERAALVTKLKSEGVTFTEIGRRLGGCSRQRAHQIWERALAQLPAPGVEQYRANDLILIDTGITELLVIARSGTTTPRTRVEAWLGVKQFMERRARLIGLDAAQRKEITVISEDTIDAEIRRLQAEMALAAQESGITLPTQP